MSEKTSENKSSSSMGLWIVVVVVILAIFAAWLFLPVRDWLEMFNAWVESLGVWGYVVFALAYIVATVVLAPGSVFTLAAGLAFGAWAFPLVVISATIGAALAFLVARYLVRDRVESKLGDKPKFKAVDKAVSDEGWKIVMLLRLSPLVPFNLQNYFFGVTDVKFWHYVAATFIGIMPGTALFIYLGSIGQVASEGGDSGSSILKWVFFGIGLIATAVVAVLISKKAKAKLEQAGLENQE